MIRLFLALTVLAFAGGACAEEKGMIFQFGSSYSDAKPTLENGIAPTALYSTTYNGPWSITFGGTNGWLVSIHPDGTIEYGEGYTPDAAAKAFWDAIGLERKNRADR